MEDESATHKQCRIKTAVVARLQKELQRYHEDLAAQVAKVARMRGDAADEHDIRKQVEVQAETEVMIPDTMRRLGKAVEDLQEFVAANDSSLTGSGQLLAAKELLAAAGGASGSGGGEQLAEEERI